jgi:hypothetical protein
MNSSRLLSVRMILRAESALISLSVCANSVGEFKTCGRRKYFPLTQTPRRTAQVAKVYSVISGHSKRSIQRSSRLGCAREPQVVSITSLRLLYDEWIALRKSALSNAIIRASLIATIFAHLSSPSIAANSPKISPWANSRKDT